MSSLCPHPLPLVTPSPSIATTPMSPLPSLASLSRLIHASLHYSSLPSCIPYETTPSAPFNLKKRKKKCKPYLQTQLQQSPLPSSLIPSSSHYCQQIPHHISFVSLLISTSSRFCNICRNRPPHLFQPGLHIFNTVVTSSWSPKNRHPSFSGSLLPLRLTLPATPPPTSIFLLQLKHLDHLLSDSTFPLIANASAFALSLDPPLPPPAPSRSHSRSALPLALPQAPSLSFLPFPIFFS